ncbi:MAG TPA: NUDIX hydrolase [Devosia sp.]|nr:NUDIX hydrolase [Devosia sp.]
MRHRISCGALVIRDARILLVHHSRGGQHDFWVAPGGGVEGGEALEAAAARETLEETGIVVRTHRLAYIEELWTESDRVVKFWFLAGYVSGSLNVANNPAADESIIEAGWFARDELPAVHVFPEPLRDRFWSDLESGFQAPIKLPLRRSLF